MSIENLLKKLDEDQIEFLSRFTLSPNRSPLWEDWGDFLNNKITKERLDNIKQICIDKKITTAMGLENYYKFLKKSNKKEVLLFRGFFSYNRNAYTNYIFERAKRECIFCGTKLNAISLAMKKRREKLVKQNFDISQPYNKIMNQIIDMFDSCLFGKNCDCYKLTYVEALEIFHSLFTLSRKCTYCKKWYDFNPEINNYNSWRLSCCCSKVCLKKYQRESSTKKMRLRRKRDPNLVMTSLIYNQLRILYNKDAKNEDKYKR